MVLTTADRGSGLWVDFSHSYSRSEIRKDVIAVRVSGALHIFQLAGRIVNSTKGSCQQP